MISQSDQLEKTTKNSYYSVLLRQMKYRHMHTLLVRLWKSGKFLECYLIINIKTFKIDLLFDPEISHLTVYSKDQIVIMYKCSIHINIYIYILYVCVCVYIYIYIYIYISRKG